MPEVYVYMVEGRTLEQKRTMAREITDVLVRTIDVPPEVVMVQFIETSPDTKAKGGILFSDRDAAQGPNRGQENKSCD
jgi:4-oxalocrotonate tautomerase